MCNRTPTLVYKYYSNFVFERVCMSSVSWVCRRPHRYRCGLYELATTWHTWYTCLTCLSASFTGSTFGPFTTVPPPERKYLYPLVLHYNDRYWFVGEDIYCSDFIYYNTYLFGLSERQLLYCWRRDIFILLCSFI